MWNFYKLMLYQNTPWYHKSVVVKLTKKLLIIESLRTALNFVRVSDVLKICVNDPRVLV